MAEDKWGKVKKPEDLENLKKLRDGLKDFEKLLQATLPGLEDIIETLKETVPKEG